MAAVNLSTAAPISPTPPVASAAQQQTPEVDDDFAAMLVAGAVATPVVRGNIQLQPAVGGDAGMPDQSVLKKNSFLTQANPAATVSLVLGQPTSTSVTAAAQSVQAVATDIVASAVPVQMASTTPQPVLSGDKVASAQVITGQAPPSRPDEAPAVQANASQGQAILVQPFSTQAIQTQAGQAPAIQTQIVQKQSEQTQGGEQSAATEVAQSQAVTDQVIQEKTVQSGTMPAPAVAARDDPKQPVAVLPTADPTAAPAPIVAASKLEPAQALHSQPAKADRRGNEIDPPLTDGLNWSLTGATQAPALTVAANPHTQAASQTDSIRSQTDNSQPRSDTPGLVALLAGATSGQGMQAGADDQNERPAGKNDTAAPSIEVANSQPSASGAIHSDMTPGRPTAGPGEQVAVHIARALQDGSKTITVELHPAELGRVEIRLSFQSDGLSVRMTVDRQETFDAFSRDRTGLEQQLGQAGVDLGTGGLDLRLGQQSDQSKSDTSGGNSRPTSALPAPPIASTTVWVGHGLVDILA